METYYIPRLKTIACLIGNFTRPFRDHEELRYVFLGNDTVPVTRIQVYLFPMTNIKALSSLPNRLRELPVKSQGGIIELYYRQSMYNTMLCNGKRIYDTQYSWEIKKLKHVKINGAIFSITPNRVYKF